MIRKALLGSALLAVLFFPSRGDAQLATIPQDRAGARGAACLVLSGSSWVPCSVANPLPVTGGGGTISLAQQGTILNSSTTGAANTPVAVTIAGAAGKRAHLYGLSAYCSAGSAALTITDNAVTVWNTPAGVVTATMVSVAWTPAPYTSISANTPLVVTLGACGGGNTGTLIVQADRN